MEPHWLMLVSWIALGLGFASALAILVDELLLGNRQDMWVMNLVHPITALYWGPGLVVGLPAPRAQGRAEGDAPGGIAADRRERLPVDTSGHWFMMQVGMIVGFFTAWPVNRWFVRSGIKEKMDRRKHLAPMVEELSERRAA